jgi:two-component system LytT family response regulator
MNFLLIEDEELTARKLARMLGELVPGCTILATLQSIEESVQWLQTHPAPDIAFMDIELADGQSFDIFTQVKVACPVIFTTAYNEFAIKAFKVNSIDYLLKPVKEEDLRNALGKIEELKRIWQVTPDALQTSLSQLLQQMTQPAPAVPPVIRDRFMIKQGQRLFSVPIEEIAYFFSRNKISFIKTFDKRELMLDYTLDELDKMLDHRKFFRLNRQIIAELRAIDKVNLYFNNKLKLTLQPAFEDEVIVSRERAAEFKVWLGE